MELTDDFQNDQFMGRVVALHDDGIDYVSSRKHHWGRYEYVTTRIARDSVRSVRIGRFLNVRTLLSGFLLIVMGMLLLLTFAHGMDWGWKTWLVAPVSVLGGVVWILKSWRLAARFSTTAGVYYWFHALRAGTSGMERVIAIEQWCRQHQIDCVNPHMISDG